MKWQRIKGTRDDFAKREQVEDAIRADPILRALYKKDYVEIDDAVATSIDNTAFKKAILRLAWILIRRATR